jgi:hypothetical protein
MTVMSPLRFVLILLLTVALDLSVPVPSHAREWAEEFEEVTTRHRGERPYRLVRDMTAPTEQKATVSQPRPRAREVSAARVRHPVGFAFVPKQPPPLAESSPSPDAH